MSDTGQGELPGTYFELLDLYCSGLIDDQEFHRLQAILLESRCAARRHFVDYYHHHTEIQFAIRSGRAADSVLNLLSFPPVRLNKPQRPEPSVAPREFDRTAWWIGVAAGAVFSLTVVAASRFGIPIGAASSRDRSRAHASSPANVAWLVNAQDCLWAGQEQKPSRDVRSGKVLRLERGLAEIEFDRGARVILQGPAGLELILRELGGRATLRHDDRTGSRSRRRGSRSARHLRR